MNRLKELQEKRGAKAKEASAIINKARDEKRELSADEQTKVAGIHGEIENIEKTIDAEVRQIAVESSKTRDFSKQEKRDIESFDIGVVLRHMAATTKGGYSKLEGLEAEMIQEGEKEARGAQITGGGVFLPRMLVRRAGFERRDLSVTGGTTAQYGGTLVATEKRGLADDFYNASVLRQNGALVLEGLVGNLDLPRYVKATNPAKKTENASADELSPTFAKLSLSPKRLPAFIDIGEQLLAQSSVALESFLRSALTSQLADVQEASFFHGNGTSEATGIAATVGIGSVAGGTNGAAPDWADIVDLESAVAVVNAASGNLRYLTNAKVRGKLKKTVKVGSTDSMMIWDDRNGGFLNGYTPVVTNAVSSTLTKGSSSVCSAIFFGNVNDYVIGYWGGLSLEMIRDSSNAVTGQYRLVASAYYDGGVMRPKSFAAMLDALTT